MHWFKSLLNRNAHSVILSAAKNLFTVLTAVLLAVSFAVSCWEPEPTPAPGPDPGSNPPVEQKDTKAPVITVSKSFANIISGPTLTVSDSELKIGDESVATWKDDVSTTLKTELTLTPNEGSSKSVNSGDKLSEEGKLKVKVSDEAGNSSEAEITLTKTDSQAPEITLNIQEKNVIAGVKVKVEGNQLFFDEQVAAAWKDDYTETCTTELRLADGQTVNSGDVLQEAGKLVISVSDEFQNKATAEIVLTAEAIYGLEGLQNLSLQVDKEVDLLQGITYADGVSLDKVEIEANGNRSVVQDPAHYIPDQTGTIAIIITVKAGERSLEFRVDNLEVKGLDYNAPKMTTANLIDEQYPWFNNMTQWYKELWYDQSVWNNKKNFVYPHVLVSYITGERYRWDNMEYIIVGEIPGIYECEDVGPNWEVGHPHADRWYFHIKSMTPFASIKASGGGWNYVIQYVDLYPDKLFMLSCASDALGGDTRDDLIRKGASMYNALKRLLKKENVIILASCFNYKEYVHSTLNENEIEHEYGMYKSASVNSEKNNMIAVVGYNPAQDNIFWDDHEGARPIGFDNVRWNIVMPFTDLVSLSDNSNLVGSTSSMPTYTLSSTLGNHLSIIMHNHPGTTLEDANTIMQERYLHSERFKYKDPDDGKIKDGEHWHFINSDKFIHEEILHETEVKSALQNTPQSLPSTGGLYYEGKGIQFTIDGETYDMTEENRSTLENAVQSGKEITWTYNADRAKNYGVTGENTITVRVMDTKARLIPDISITVQVR